MRLVFHILHVPIIFQVKKLPGVWALFSQGKLFSIVVKIITKALNSKLSTMA